MTTKMHTKPLRFAKTIDSSRAQLPFVSRLNKTEMGLVNTIIVIFIPNLVCNYDDDDDNDGDDHTNKQASKQTNVHDTIINNRCDYFAWKLVVVDTGFVFRLHVVCKRTKFNVNPIAFVQAR